MLINKYLAFSCLKGNHWSMMQLTNLYKSDLTHVQQIKVVQSIWCKCKKCSAPRFKFKKDDGSVGMRCRFKWFSHVLDAKEFVDLKNGVNAKNSLNFYNGGDTSNVLTKE